jgi:hypothetical protein
MQLEKLKKAELVKLARELRQENKLLKKQVDNVKNVELDDSKLPLLAHTYYKQDGQHIVDIVKYSPASNNVKLHKRLVESTKYLALHKMDINVAEHLDEQTYEGDKDER